MPANRSGFVEASLEAAAVLGYRLSYLRKSIFLETQGIQGIYDDHANLQFIAPHLIYRLECLLCALGGKRKLQSTPISLLPLK
jgi:hypothetical protein